MAFTNQLVILTNAGLGTDYLIRDLGFPVPASGGQVTLDEYEEVLRAAMSEDLREAVVDDAIAVGSSSIILNDGTGNIPQADAIAFLDSIISVSHADAGNYGLVKTDGNGEIREDLTTSPGSPSQLNNWQLGTDLDANGNEITNLPATPSAPGSAASKAYVDSIAVGGKVWKELILSCEQLIDGGVGVGGLSQAIPYWLTGQPSVSQTFVISDGTTTETYTFLASESSAFDVAIGATVDDTMANLAQAILDDSALWEASAIDSLQDFNTRTVIIWRTAQALTSYDDRIYGSAGGEYVNYNGQLDYEFDTSSALPAADPGQKEFGLGRDHASLTVNETHACRDIDTAYTWDGDGDQWQNTGSNGIQAGAGLDKVGDVLSVDFADPGDTQTVGSANAEGSVDRAARADHVHDHGDQSGVSATHHDTTQIDEDTALNQSLGTSAGTDQSTINQAIDAALANAALRGKIITYSETQKVPGSGTRYLQIGPLLSSKVGKRMLRNGSISGLSIEVEVVDGSRSFDLEVQRSTDGGSTWNVIASVNLPVSTLGVSTVAPTGSLAFNANELIRARVVRASGSGSSTFKNIDVTVEYTES